MKGTPMARHFHDNCTYCGTQFQGPVHGDVQSEVASHEGSCESNPANQSTEDIIDKARKELGD